MLFMQKCATFIFSILLLAAFSCKKNEVPATTTEEAMYFPSITDNNWETKTISSLNWNQSAIQPLKDYLALKGSKSFMILVNGRIAMEEYFNGHNATAAWQWNSAGKTLTSAATGIAQQEGLININTKVSTYLGNGWTSAPLLKENLITPKHLLSMTTGLSDASELPIPANLTYMADAGTRWSYNNVFQKLMDVVAAASAQTFDAYYTAKIKNKIGMEGFWNNGLIYKIYHSNTRSMAKFGLLALNKGKWNNEQVLNETFFNESINTSQNLNPSYGYLWWLNGKSSAMIPGGQTSYPGTLVPNAPAEMYAAMGAADQRIYVVPSKKMVIIRMGEASNPANPNFAVSGFDNELWSKLNAVFN